MLHLLPQDEPEAPAAYAEAVSRLASVRHALRLVDGGLAAGPEGDLDDDIVAAWPEAGEARRHLFGRRSAQLVSTVAAGVEVLLGPPHPRREPHPAPPEVVVGRIPRDLPDLA